MGLEKQPRYLNRKLLDLARGMPCQHCGIEDGTTVAAHSNFAIHGHGRGIKSHDIFTAWLCAECHRKLDQGDELSKEEKLEMFRRAMEKTFLHLWREGKIKL